MSVVTRQARRRWVTVAAGVVALICVPFAVRSAVGLAGDLGAGGARDAKALFASARASESVPYSGLAQSTGTLGLPDLPQLGDVAAQLGGTTRTRAWWAAPDRWRVSVLSPTGEQDLYVDGPRDVRWDYERDTLTAVVGSSPLRLPRADDLMPPQAARRLLGGVGGRDRLEPIRQARTVAGVRAEGLRVVPADARSTIGHADVWLDPRHGLPLAIEVVDTRGVTALRSAFLDVDFGPPDAADLAIPAPAGADLEVTEAPDLASRISRVARGRFSGLPGSLAGVPSSDPLVGGTGTYGAGLVRFVVVPLPPRIAGQALDATRTGGGTELDVPGGEALQVNAGLINLVVARRTDQLQAVVLAGLVSGDLLADAATELLQDPRATFG